MGIILEHLIKDHGATLEQAKVALAKWNIQPLEVDGKQIGEYMTQNNEIHIALLPEYRKLLGRKHLIKTCFKQVLTGKEFLVTRLFKHDKQRRLVEFLGFKHTHSDAKYDYFWLDEGNTLCWQ